MNMSIIYILRSGLLWNNYAYYSSLLGMTICLYVIDCGAGVLLGTVEGQGICAPDAGVNLKKQKSTELEHASFIDVFCHKT